MNPLLTEIEAFLATHGMSASRFGLKAVNDKHFVRDLRGEGKRQQPRRNWPETEGRVRAFMVTYQPEPRLPR